MVAQFFLIGKQKFIQKAPNKRGHNLHTQGMYKRCQRKKKTHPSRKQQKYDLFIHNLDYL